MMFTKLLLDKEMDDVGNSQKSACEAMTLADNLVLICKFQGCNLVFCLL